MTQPSNNSGLSNIFGDFEYDYPQFSSEMNQIKQEIEANYIPRSEVLGLLPEKDMDGPDAGEFEKGQASGFNNAVDQMAKNIREKS